MIPQSFIQDLLGRLDIVEVVGRFVRLKKAGANWLGLCPFHGEKSPSFTVSPSKQFYHCFGCGAHGSAIGFLMEHAGLGYVEAIEDLARGVGLSVPASPGSRRGFTPASGARNASERSDPRDDPDPSDPRNLAGSVTGAADGPGNGPGSGHGSGRTASAGLLDVCARAARFYKTCLKESARAVDYLKGRGVTGETAARFAIGYAPDGWRALEAAMPDYQAFALLEAGLVIESTPDEGVPTDGSARRRRYDRFRDRIMFPIRNPRGQVIGFGGRILGPGEPKYLNSPETPLFSKGRELYGLYEAREAIRAEACVVVVEGYMDVVMLAQHGVRHAVATLGTATTAQHVQKLMRLVDRVVFAFDGDAAGRKAAWRALEACLPILSDQKRIDFLFLPPEHDPDSFVRAEGADGFRRALQNALPLSAVLLRELDSRVDLATPEGRARLQAEARPLLKAVPLTVALRGQLLALVAEKAEVRVDDLLGYLGEWPTPGGGGKSRFGAAGLGAGRGQGSWAPFKPPRPAAIALPDLERRAQLLLALHPELARLEWDRRFIPESVLDWIGWLAALPSQSNLGLVLETLRSDEPQRAAALEREIRRDRGLLAGLPLEEAQVELAGALDRLRDRQLREEADRLAGSGLTQEAERARYLEIQSLRRSLAQAKVN